ncbi:MAG: GAF domain-containing protein [Acidobacteriaceae bacterium]
MLTLTYSQLLADLEAAAQKASSVEALMQTIVERLRDNLPAYNWVGFYMIEEKPGTEPMLILGPFVGADTPHKRIPLNQGICGAAASTGETVVVDDVHSDPRYLACSIETRSEIVAPIFANGKVVGELDIDSHRPSAFCGEDRQLVESCAALVGRYLERK